MILGSLMFSFIFYECLKLKWFVKLSADGLRNLGKYFDFKEDFPHNYTVYTLSFPS